MTRIIALRKRNYAVYEINQVLTEEGTPPRATAVAEEGFAASLSVATQSDGGTGVSLRRYLMEASTGPPRILSLGSGEQVLRPRSSTNSTPHRNRHRSRHGVRK